MKNFPQLKTKIEKKKTKPKTWPYSPVDGMAMGYRLGSNLANIFLWHHKSNWFKRWPKKLTPKYHEGIVDDNIVLFEKPEHLQ